MKRWVIAAACGVTIVGLALGAATVTGTLGDGRGDTPRRDDSALDTVRSGKVPADCELPASGATLADANLGFAWRSFKAVDADLRGDKATSTYSPYSAATAFQMLVNGADPGTDEQLLAALCVDSELDQMNGSARDLRDRLEEGEEVEVANSIWASPEHTPTDRLRRRIADDFDGEVGNFQFGNAGPLNAWIKGHTKGRIPELLEDGDLHTDMVMVLINAITFDGMWKEKFEPPTQQPFHLSGGDPVDVATLQESLTLEHYFSEKDTTLLYDPREAARQAPDAFQAVRIPYAGGRYSMIVVLPLARDGLDDVVDSLGPKRWRQVRSKFTDDVAVAVSMPTLDLKEQHDIKPAMFSIGVPEGSYNRLIIEPENPIVIDFVKQGTFLQVDENGTKAAAATAVGGGVLAGGPISLPFRADHPYLLAIEERKSGELLFLSAIRDPRG